jgi:hypothetical protein
MPEVRPVEQFLEADDLGAVGGRITATPVTDALAIIDPCRRNIHNGLRDRCAYDSQLGLFRRAACLWFLLLCVVNISFMFL